MRPAPIEIRPPATRDEIIDAFDSIYRQSDAYWSRYDTREFFAPIGQAWSPAENVRHLIKSTRPVAKALTIPKWILRIRFGKPKRPPESYQALHDRYDAALAAGGKAGRFAPAPKTEPDLQAWREKIMRQRSDVHAELIRNLKRWPEASLDRVQVPHPLLGKLTMREMMFFTLYHHIHHIEVVERRRAEARTA